MKKFLCFMAILMCVAPVAEIAAHSSSSSHWYFSQEDNRPNRERVIGDFRIIGRGKGKIVDLANNVFYKPSKARDKRKSKKWKVGNVVRVLRTKTKRDFVLINLTLGSTIETKTVDLDSNS